ncbi:MAG: hypothetical protein K2I36_02860 [Ureaplasma sp.]|nr:hypothetical protein [Ureaplasma sp.]MDE7221797.1 hypothetical protein [Ureaplasma sp.]
MKKNKLKMFIAFTSLLVPSTLVLPVITSSCVSSDNWDFKVDQSNKSILINSNFFSNFANIESSSIFNIYQYLMQNATNTEFIDKLNESLSTFTNNLLSNYSINWNSVELDLTNFQININVASNVVSTFVTESDSLTDNNSSEISKISIVFKKYTNELINNFLNSNTKTYNKNNFLVNYTFEDILNPEIVTDEQICIAAGLNINTTKILYRNVNDEPTIRFGEITNNTNENTKSLNLLFFDYGSGSNSKGLGQLVISQKEVDVTCIPSKYLLDIFGSDINNDFIDILQNQSLYPDVSDWKYNTNTTITPTLPLDTLLLTYSDFLNLNANIVNKKISSYNLSHFKKDYNFFVNNYFNYIFDEWNIPSLYTTGLYACNNVTYNESTGFTGSIGLNIYNKTTLTKKLKLPITNEEVLIEGNSNIVILIELNNSKITPTLVENTSLSNSANLVPTFSNVTVKYIKDVPEASNDNKVVPQINWLATNFDDVSDSWFSSSIINNANIFGNSLSLQCIVEKVTVDKNFIDSLSVIEKSKTLVTADSLKNLKLQQLTESYNMVSTIVKSVESLMLKISDNPTIYDLLQNISSEMYNIINAITNNPDISNLVSQLFTTNKTSIYLLNNIDSIINILNSLDNGSSTQLTEIIKLLSEIISNHNDPIKMHQWVASIEGLYPTLEKLLDNGAAWILPMVGQIMRGLSQDVPIVEFAFNNMDYVLTYLSQDSVTTNLGFSTQNIIKSVHTYLNNLVEYSKTLYPTTTRATTIQNTAAMQEKYKNIHALDIFTYELTNNNSANSILTLISSILAPIDASTANILSFISNILANNVEVSQTIIDNTNATFENAIVDTKPTTGIFTKSGTYSLDPKTGYKIASGSTTTTLSNQIGKCIKSLFNVTYGGKEMLLSNVLNAMGNSQSNINMIVNNNFSYSNYQVTQDLEVNYSFKQELKWDLLPISCFLDNLKIGITDADFDNLVTYITGLLPTAVSSLVTISKSNLRSWLYLFAGISFTDYVDSNGIAKLSIDLARIFPTDLTIKPENNFILQYKATNASIYPIITSDGIINWGYDAFENIIFNDRTVLDNANQEFTLNSANDAAVKINYSNNSSTSTYALNISYTNKDLKTEQLNLLKTQKYYGCQYSTFKKFLLDQIDIKQYSSNLPSALKIAISLLPANKINKPIIINPEPSTTNISSIFQSNTTSSIKDYNTNVYNPNYNVERIGQGETELITDLTNFVNNYLVWTASTSNANQDILTMESGASIALNDLIKKYYNISNSVNFQAGISGQVTQLLNKTYTYNLYINFDRPVLYTYTDATGVVTKSITQQVTLSFTMSTAPTKPTTTA